MHPRFTRPGSPVSLADQDALRMFLEQHGIDSKKWDTKRLQEFWSELCSSDSLLTLDRIPESAHQTVTRNIRTVTIRISHETDRDKTRYPGGLRSEILTEFKIRDGRFVPRKYSRSSVSEKLHWNAPGSEEEPADAIKRAFAEELNLHVCDTALGEDRIFHIPPKFHVRATNNIDLYPDSFQEDARNKQVQYLYASEIWSHEACGTELDIRWSGNDKFPGILVKNQLAHYVWRMPTEYYRAEGYLDTRTRYKSIWLSPDGSYNH